MWHLYTNTVSSLLLSSVLFVFFFFLSLSTDGHSSVVQFLSSICLLCLCKTRTVHTVILTSYRGSEIDAAFAKLREQFRATSRVAWPRSGEHSELAGVQDRIVEQMVDFLDASDETGVRGSGSGADVCRADQRSNREADGELSWVSNHGRDLDRGVNHTT